MKKYFVNFVKSWKQYAVLQVATLSILTLSFSVIVLALVLSKNVNNTIESWGENIKISVFLGEEATSNQKKRLKNEIKKMKLIENVNYISKDAAKEFFKNKMKNTLPDLYTDDDLGNPFPASFELTLKSGLGPSSNIGQLIEGFVKKLQTKEIVEDVTYGKSWINNYSSLLAVFAKSSLLLIAVLAFGSMFVVSNSIKNSIHHRREEISVLELFGATKAMIRIPFVIEGALMGVIAMIIALICSYFIFNWQSKILFEGLGFWNFITKLSFLTSMESCGLILLSFCIGAISSFICVRSISSGWSAAEGMSEL